MSRTLKRAFLAIFVFVLGGCASSGSGASESADPRPQAATPAPEPAGSAADAPTSDASSVARSTSFTDAQADRGRDMFRGSCTECHYSGEFADSQFQFKWSRRTAGSLYQLIQTSMPETAPGSLTPEQSVDLVSYILRMNGFDPGAAELSADREVLDAISLAGIR